MLDNSLKREGVKATGALLAAASTPDGLVATSLVAILGVATEALGLLGEKRTKELFDTDQLACAISEKLKTSDDFAGFVFSVWQKHNLESSRERRKYLKTFLEHETYNDKNDFQNFTKIEFLIQNASLKSLQLLQLLHRNNVQRKLYGSDHSPPNVWNLRRLIPVVKNAGWDIHEQDLEYFINELASSGLLSVRHNVLDGPFYNSTKMGFVMVSYINSD